MGEREHEILSEDEKRKLVDQVCAIEDRFGFPVDIEWAIGDGKIWILQSRSIATRSHASPNAVELQRVMQRTASSSYKLVFRISGLDLLFASLLMEVYKHLGCIFLFMDGIFSQYTPTASILQANKDGLILFGDRTAFSEYRSDFLEAADSVSRVAAEMIAADSISRVKLRDLISHAVNLLDLYSKMDSMYTDGLFLVSGAGNDKNESLEELGSFKNECRELVNTFFLTADSYFLKVLGLASRQFGVSLYDLKRYSILELVGLFDGTAISQEAVSGRSQSFCIASEDSVYTLIVGHSVKQLFLSLAGEPADWGPELVGTVASVGAGRTTSSVKVIKVNYSSFDSIEMQVSTMPEGAVLVAETTAPELILACRKASGIVTDMGGMLSHAAIVSRELGIPAIVGTERATLVLKDGDIVELDCARGMTGQGFVRLLKNDNSTFDRGAIVSPQGIWSGH